jgi:hypothetical protein
VDDEALRSGQDVVREVLAALAPGELPYVAAVLRAYRIEPWTLGGDLPAALPVSWTPFVLGFVAETVVALAAGEPVPAGPRRSGKLFRPWPLDRWRLDRWRRPRDVRWASLPDLPIPAFDEDQLRTVWAAAIDAATEHGRSLGDREAFAAAVVAALSVGHVPRPLHPPQD